MLDSSYKVKQNGTKQEEKEQRAARLKILTPKQMLQRLSIALAQAKAGSNSESLLNKIRQIVYSLYQWKEITKQVYNNIIRKIAFSYKNGYYPANIRLDEDVLKTSFVFVFGRRLQDVFKTSWSRQICSPQPYVFRRRLQDGLGQDQYICLGHMSLRRLEEVFKTSSRRFEDLLQTSSKRLQGVFKTFWRRNQDVFKISSRRFQGVPSS